MIRNAKEFKSETRHNMRDGNGDVIIDHILNCSDDLKSNTRLFAKLTLEKGCSIGKHDHIGEEEIFYILKGTAKFDDNGTEKILRAGDVAVTSDSSHAIANAGDETLEIMAAILKF